MNINAKVSLILGLSMAFVAVAVLGAEVKSSPRSIKNKLDEKTSPSTISGIMVKPSSATPAGPKNPLAEIEDMDEADEQDIDDQVQAVPLPSSNSAILIPAASSDLKTAAGYHYPSHHHEGGHHGGHHYGKYYQYASVPYPYSWEFGYRRGNPYHTIERHEKGKGSHFHTKVKWSDKHAGYGVHVWDYNHDDHHSKHYDAGHHGDSYGAGHHAGHGHGYGHH